MWQVVETRRAMTDKPYWDDIASALEDVLETEPVNMPGLKAMIIQAIAELRALKQGTAIKANPAVLEYIQSCAGTDDDPLCWRNADGSCKPCGLGMRNAS